MVSSCSKLLNDFDKQFTVKTRTGIYANKSVAHELIPKFEEWGASLVTVIYYHSYYEKYSNSVNSFFRFMVDRGNNDIRKMPIGIT